MRYHDEIRRSQRQAGVAERTRTEKCAHPYVLLALGVERRPARFALLRAGRGGQTVDVGDGGGGAGAEEDDLDVVGQRGRKRVDRAHGDVWVRECRCRGRGGCGGSHVGRDGGAFIKRGLTIWSDSAEQAIRYQPPHVYGASPGPSGRFEQILA